MTYRLNESIMSLREEISPITKSETPLPIVFYMYMYIFERNVYKEYESFKVCEMMMKVDCFCLKNLYEKSLYEIVFLRRERSTISRIFFVLFFL